MEEKKYKVLDHLNHPIAREMSLDAALLLMKAYCQEYYLEALMLTLQEEDRCDASSEIEDYNWLG